jgi:hypothetical protein
MQTGYVLQLNITFCETQIVKQVKKKVIEWLKPKRFTSMWVTNNTYCGHISFYSTKIADPQTVEKQGYIKLVMLIKTTMTHFHHLIV